MNLYWISSLRFFQQRHPSLILGRCFRIISCKQVRSYISVRFMEITLHLNPLFVFFQPGIDKIDVHRIVPSAIRICRSDSPFRNAELLIPLLGKIQPPVPSIRLIPVIGYILIGGISRPPVISIDSNQVNIVISRIKECGVLCACLARATIRIEDKPEFGRGFS